MIRHNTKKKYQKNNRVYSLLFREVIYFFSSPCIIIITSSRIVLVVTYIPLFFICGSVHTFMRLKLLDTRKNRGVAPEFKERKERKMKSEIISSRVYLKKDEKRGSIKGLGTR